MFLFLLVLAFTSAVYAGLGAADARVDRALEKFRVATSVDDQPAAGAEIARLGLDYDDAARRLHDMPWRPVLKPSFEQFVLEHPRNPLPDTLNWQVGKSDPFRPAHRLVIDRLGGADAEIHVKVE